MSLFYGTFGSAHLCGMGCDKYVVVEAEDISEANKIMFKQFGQYFCMVYTSPEEAGVDEYDLTSINVYDKPLTKSGVGLFD